MKCICRVACQSRDDSGYIRTFFQGDVFSFDKCPTHFEKLDGEKINFSTAGEEELLEAEYELKDLKDFIFKTFKRKAGSRAKESTVALLLDCRFRDIGSMDLNKVI